MCPLRIILIFLSATLAGFFVLRNLKSQPDAAENDVVDNDSPVKAPSDTSSSNMIGNGFWTCVDMASGKYLWRHLASSSNMKRTE
nr:Methyltransferase-related protein [Ipomoea batatas]